MHSLQVWPWRVERTQRWTVWSFSSDSSRSHGEDGMVRTLHCLRRAVTGPGHGSTGDELTIHWASKAGWSFISWDGARFSPEKWTEDAKAWWKEVAEVRPQANEFELCHIGSREDVSVKLYNAATFLVVQWLRICLSGRGHRFNPWSGKVLQAEGQVNPGATTPEAHAP